MQQADTRSPQPYAVFKILIAMLLIILQQACSRLDEATEAKIEYWDQQAQMMILAGPQKGKVFAWVYAIDPNASYSGDQLVANLETITNAHSTERHCIVLKVKFDTNERVRDHRVSYSQSCE